LSVLSQYIAGKYDSDIREWYVLWSRILCGVSGNAASSDDSVGKGGKEKLLLGDAFGGSVDSLCNAVTVDYLTFNLSLLNLQ